MTPARAMPGGSDDRRGAPEGGTPEDLPTRKDDRQPFPRPLDRVFWVGDRPRNDVGRPIDWDDPSPLWQAQLAVLRAVRADGEVTPALRRARRELRDALYPSPAPRTDGPVADLPERGRGIEYMLRDELRPLARPRCAKCGRVKVRNAWAPGVGENVEVWVGEVGGQRRASYRNLMYCGSAWECPVCMARHRRENAAIASYVVQQHEARCGEGSVLMLTGTAHHGLGDDLREVRQGITRAWSLMLAGKMWGRFCAGTEVAGIYADWGAGLNGRVPSSRYIVGGVRALEVTHGRRYGWHPHIHALLFLDAPPSDATIKKMRDWIAPRWCSAVRRTLGDEYVPMEGAASDGKYPGCDLRRAGDGQYIAKMGLEPISSMTKRGRGDSRTPMQIACDYATTHDLADAKLWQTYCSGMDGARMLTWFGDVREPEVSDEPASVVPEPNAQRVASIDDVTWARVRDVRGAKLAILVAAEESAADGVREALAYIIANRQAPPPRDGAQRAGP